MRYKVAGYVETRKLYAIIILARHIEDTGGDPFRRLSARIPRIHAVDIRIIGGPEPLADIHGGRIDGRDHQNLIIFYDRSPLLQLL